MTKLVILDRDGVINRDSDAFVKNLSEWIPLPGSIQAIANLSQQGFTVTVATNQSGISRGLLTEQALKQMHAELNRLVEDAGGVITRIIYCPHGPDDGCDCRKPKAGMFIQLLEELGQPELSWVIGDSLRDLQAGCQVGCMPLLVTTGKGEKTRTAPDLPPDTRVFRDLSAAADWLISAYS